MYTTLPFISHESERPMIGLSTLAVFSLAALALTVTPGPDMLLIASRSASQGRAAGFATLAGIQVGTYLHATAAALGLSQLLIAVPAAYDAIRYAGAAYLLYLAWKTLGAPVTRTEMQAAQAASLRTVFVQGLGTNLLNPKMALFVLALFPQFVEPQAGSMLLQMLTLATVINVLGLLVNGLVIVFAAAFSKRWQQSKPSPWPQRILGTVFAGLAGKLLLASRN